MLDYLVETVTDEKDNIQGKLWILPGSLMYSIRDEINNDDVRGRALLTKRLNQFVRLRTNLDLTFETITLGNAVSHSDIPPTPVIVAMTKRHLKCEEETLEGELNDLVTILKRVHKGIVSSWLLDSFFPEWNQQPLKNN